ncbi:hypothetical protein D9611_010310 [Ephemerocybe angulata]|uniref:Uncharacterized protein n=1 Tax=Ephemerocybe angulata TaxID=980116 RepID=A0A8H5BB55_9AGAR|nr:hypothetical protein D9611_010310 [Tulosesus angulatus]
MQSQLLSLFLLLTCAFSAVLASPTRVLSTSLFTRDAPEAQTNARRMAQGLAPLTPRKLFSPTCIVARGPLPSSKPSIMATISVRNKDGAYIGYTNAEGQVFEWPQAHSAFTFKNPSSSSERVELFITALPTHRVALSTGRDIGIGGPPYIGPGSPHILLWHETSDSTASGSPPALDFSDIYYETTIWSLEAPTGTLSAVWVNPAGFGTSTVHFVQRSRAGEDARNIVGVGDVAAYKAAVASNDPGLIVEEVTLSVNSF